MLFKVFYETVVGKFFEENPKLHDFWEKYKLLQSDEDRYKFLSPILETLQFPEVPVSLKREKSSVKSQELREAGNRLFIQGKLCSALRTYTESVAFAPPNSESLCLAHGNRSAALKSLGFLRECVQEIDGALALGYPASLAHKLHQRRAECLLKLGEQDEALQSFASATASLDQAGLDPAARDKKTLELTQKSEACKLATKTPNVAKLSLDSPTKKKEPPSLSYGLSTELTGASDCIALRYNKQFGRHLVATRDILPGDIVAVERPYAAFLRPDCATPGRCQHNAHCSYTHCSHCFSRCPTLLPCTKCAWAMFCSEKCLQAAHYHDLECALVPTLLAWDMGYYSLYLLRVLSVTGVAATLRYLDNIPPGSGDPRTLGFTGDKLLPTFHAIYHLARNSELRDSADMRQRNVASWCFVKCMADLLPEPDKFGALFLRLFQILSVNSEGIAEFYIKPDSNDDSKICIGGAIYTTISYLTHSCDYNCERIFVGNTEVIQAIQPIKKGSVLTITYHGKFLQHARSQRRATMLARYQFECRCEACEEDWPMLTELCVRGMLPDNLPPGKVRNECEKALFEMQDVYMRSKHLSQRDVERVKDLLVLLYNSGCKLSFAYHCFLRIYEEAAGQKGNQHQDKFH